MPVHLIHIEVGEMLLQSVGVVAEPGTVVVVLTVVGLQLVDPLLVLTLDFVGI